MKISWPFVSRRKYEDTRDLLEQFAETNHYLRRQLSKYQRPRDERGRFTK